MLKKSLFYSKASLTSKLSVLVTVAVLMVIGVLGVYFDNQLKSSFLDSTQKRLQHAYKRLVYNLGKIEDDLHRGIAFVRTDQRMIASIELVNNYQDKTNTIHISLMKRRKLSQKSF